jgi:hypothetical protein
MTPLDLKPLDLKQLDRDYFFAVRPKVLMQELKDVFGQVELATTSNDIAPCLLIERRVRLFLPNSIRQNEEETNEYLVCYDDGEDTPSENTQMFMFDRLDHASDKIFELLEEIEPWNALVHQLRVVSGEVANLTNTVEESDTSITLRKIINRIEFKLRG